MNKSLKLNTTDLSKGTVSPRLKSTTSLTKASSPNYYKPKMISPTSTCSSDIFERSFCPPSPTGRSSTTSTNGSISGAPSHHNLEDYIAPVLDATAEILTDPKIDYSEVQVVCCDDENDEETDEENQADVEQLYFSLRPAGDFRRKSWSNVDRIAPTRTRSRSLISNSLLSSLGGHKKKSVDERDFQREKFEDREENREEMVEASKTINFYSFADMCNREHFEEMEGSPISRRHSTNPSNPSRPSRKSSVVSLPGFTTVSMKEYISL